MPRIHTSIRRRFIDWRVPGGIVVTIQTVRDRHLPLCVREPASDLANATSEGRSAPRMHSGMFPCNQKDMWGVPGRTRARRTSPGEPRDPTQIGGSSLAAQYAPLGTSAEG